MFGVSVYDFVEKRITAVEVVESFWSGVAYRAVCGVELHMERCGV